MSNFIHSQMEIISSVLQQTQHPKCDSERVTTKQVKKRTDWVGRTGLNVLMYHIHWPSLNTMNSIFSSKLLPAHHTNATFCSLGQNRAVPLQHLTLAHKGFLQQATPGRWRQRWKLTLATSALKSNPIRNLHFCSDSSCLKTDWKSSFHQWWRQDRVLDTHALQYCRFKVKSKKVGGK